MKQRKNETKKNMELLTKLNPFAHLNGVQFVTEEQRNTFAENLNTKPEDFEDYLLRNMLFTYCLGKLKLTPKAIANSTAEQMKGYAEEMCEFFEKNTLNIEKLKKEAAENNNEAAKADDIQKANVKSVIGLFKDAFSNLNKEPFPDVSASTQEELSAALTLPEFRLHYLLGATAVYEMQTIMPKSEDNAQQNEFYQELQNEFSGGADGLWKQRFIIADTTALIFTDATDIQKKAISKILLETKLLPEFKAEKKDMVQTTGSMDKTYTLLNQNDFYYLKDDTALAMLDTPADQLNAKYNGELTEDILGAGLLELGGEYWKKAKDAAALNKEAWRKADTLPKLNETQFSQQSVGFKKVQKAAMDWNLTDYAMFCTSQPDFMDDRKLHTHDHTGYCAAFDEMLKNLDEAENHIRTATSDLDKEHLSIVQRLYITTADGKFNHANVKDVMEQLLKENGVPEKDYWSQLDGYDLSPGRSMRAFVGMCMTNPNVRVDLAPLQIDPFTNKMIADKSRAIHGSNIKIASAQQEKAPVKEEPEILVTNMNRMDGLDTNMNRMFSANKEEPKPKEKPKLTEEEKAQRDAEISQIKEAMIKSEKIATKMQVSQLENGADDVYKEIISCYKAEDAGLKDVVEKMSKCLIKRETAMRDTLEFRELVSDAQEILADLPPERLNWQIANTITMINGFHTPSPELRNKFASQLADAPAKEKELIAKNRAKSDQVTLRQLEQKIDRTAKAEEMMLAEEKKMAQILNQDPEQAAQIVFDKINAAFKTTLNGYHSIKEIVEQMSDEDICPRNEQGGIADSPEFRDLVYDIQNELATYCHMMRLNDEVKDAISAINAYSPPEYEQRVKFRGYFGQAFDDPKPELLDEQEEAEAKRKLEEEKNRQEAEAKRKLEEEKNRQEAEAKRKLEEEKNRQEAEAKRKLEEEKNRQEAELKNAQKEKFINEVVAKGWKLPKEDIGMIYDMEQKLPANDPNNPKARQNRIRKLITDMPKGIIEMPKVTHDLNKEPHFADMITRMLLVNIQTSYNSAINEKLPGFEKDLVLYKMFSKNIDRIKPEADRQNAILKAQVHAEEAARKDALLENQKQERINAEPQPEQADQQVSDRDRDRQANAELLKAINEHIDDLKAKHRTGLGGSSTEHGTLKNKVKDLTSTLDPYDVNYSSEKKVTALREAKEAAEAYIAAKNHQHGNDDPNAEVVPSSEMGKRRYRTAKAIITLCTNELDKMSNILGAKAQPAAQKVNPEDDLRKYQNILKQSVEKNENSGIPANRLSEQEFTCLAHIMAFNVAYRDPQNDKPEDPISYDPKDHSPISRESYRKGLPLRLLSDPAFQRMCLDCKTSERYKDLTNKATEGYGAQLKEEYLRIKNIINKEQKIKDNNVKNGLNKNLQNDKIKNTVNNEQPIKNNNGKNELNKNY